MPGRKATEVEVKVALNNENQSPQWDKIFDDVQRSVVSHNRRLTSLSKIYRQDPDNFFTQFVPYLNKILIIFKKENCVKRLMSFIVAFFTKPELLEEEERDDLVDDLLT